ncbi:MAG TPA: gliding motility-associated C-terminal domain-containing protein, partial [Cyclobacteriaceae bacterium]
ITVTAKGGCRDVSSSFHINAVPYPDDATDLTGPTEICDGTSVTFKTSAINNITSYEWQIPDTFTPNGVIHSTDNFITAKVQSQGLRTVSVNGINKCDQKGNDKTLEVQTWDKVPIPFLKRMPCDREIVSSENENIEWYKDGILIPDFKYDHFPVLDSGIYQVRVSNFCNAEKSNTVKAYPLYESQLSVPNVITPNGDDKNQHFELEPSLRGSSLSIFNRYGKNVFESPNYNNKWMGEDLPMGVYYYLINNSCLTKPLRGWIQLLH